MTKPFNQLTPAQVLREAQRIYKENDWPDWVCIDDQCPVSAINIASDNDTVRFDSIILHDECGSFDAAIAAAEKEST